MPRAVALACLLSAIVFSASAQTPPPTAEAEPGRVFCEQSVSFRIADPATVPGLYRRFLGVWSDAAWDAEYLRRADRRQYRSRTAPPPIIYAYGPLGSSARTPGGVLHGTGIIRDGELRFQNSDGTQFAFRPGIVDLIGQMTTPNGQSYEAVFKKTL